MLTHKHLALALLTAATLASTGSAQSQTPIEQLGKQLFFDKISRPADRQACAACHDPSAGWTGGVEQVNARGAVYSGANPRRFGNRKPPTAAYSTYSTIFHEASPGRFVGGVFWDGRATGHELANPAADQALGPFLNPVEQNMQNARAVCQHVEQSEYAELFEQVWGPGSLSCAGGAYRRTYDRIGWSIAAFEASEEVSPFTSRFDAYWRACRVAGNSPDACGNARGEQNVLDPGGILDRKQFDGLVLFVQNCSSCHVSHIEGAGGRPPLFSDFSFFNLGVPKNPDNPFYGMDKVFLPSGEPINPLGAAYVDLGLGAFLRSVPEWAGQADANDGKFRTPTVRNVDQRPRPGFTKAYMHNGVFKSLEQVVHFYNTRDVASANWPPPEVPQNVIRRFGNLGLDADAEAALVAFLEALNDGWQPPPGLARR